MAGTGRMWVPWYGGDAVIEAERKIFSLDWLKFSKEGKLGLVLQRRPSFLLRLALRKVRWVHCWIFLSLTIFKRSFSICSLYSLYGKSSRSVKIETKKQCWQVERLHELFPLSGVFILVFFPDAPYFLWELPQWVCFTQAWYWKFVLHNESFH